MKTTDQEDARMIEDPTRWPLWPILPVKRSQNGVWPEAGIIMSGDRHRVWKMSMFRLGELLGGRILKKDEVNAIFEGEGIEYEQAEDAIGLVDKGWRVD